jgi:hypothetical protein
MDMPALPRSTVDIADCLADADGSALRLADDPDQRIAVLAGWHR